MQPRGGADGGVRRESILLHLPIFISRRKLSCLFYASPHPWCDLHKKLPPMASETTKSLESWLWDATCSIRGAKDALKFKDYIFPLVFTKRLCDVFDDEINRIAALFRTS